MKNELVKLWKRPSYDGNGFTFYLVFVDLNGKRRKESLGHADARKAERQRAAKERDLRMGVVERDSMKLSEFFRDSMERCGNQIRPSTKLLHENAMNHFIRTAGDIDFRSITHAHGERFVRNALDSDNKPATVARKLRHLKRLFKLAVDRDQLETNPFKNLRPPKSPERKVRIYTPQELQRLCRVVKEGEIGAGMRWDLMILLSLTTGLRRGEVLNLTWHDIDFENKTIDVQAKEDTQYTWEWRVKDTDRRTIALTDDVVQLLAEHQAEQPEGHAYVFIPPARYDAIQKLRDSGKWTLINGCQPLNNFTRQFELLCKRAAIKNATFHDLRRTCLTNWFYAGLSIHDVMTLAGHASFETTRRFYLAVDADGLHDRARRASAQSLESKVGTNVVQLLKSPKNEKGPTNVSACQPNT